MQYYCAQIPHPWEAQNQKLSDRKHSILHYIFHHGSHYTKADILAAMPWKFHGIFFEFRYKIVDAIDSTAVPP